MAGAIAKRKVPKPCPTCYSPMDPNADGEFACAKHGVPGQRPPEPTNGHPNARAALDAMDAGEPQQPAPVRKTSPKQKRLPKGHWTPESVIAAIREAAEELGHPPAASGYVSLAKYARKTHGTWADAVEAAGFPRPTKGTRYDKKSGPVPAAPTVAVPADPPPSQEPEPLAADPGATRSDPEPPGATDRRAALLNALDAGDALLAALRALVEAT